MIIGTLSIDPSIELGRKNARVGRHGREGASVQEDP